MKKIQRRDFLKAMGLTTAALGLTACGGSASLCLVLAGMPSFHSSSSSSFIKPETMGRIVPK